MNFVYALIVALLAVFAIAPLEYPGAFQSHSGLSAVYNLINLDQNPLAFWNWSPTFGSAFDLFRTEGALPYWIAEIFHRVGFGYLDSIKLVYALAWLISGWTMFALARKYFSESGALVAAMVYIYLPYHIATVYVRGAFAEAVVWALMPAALASVVNRQSSVASKRTFVLSLLSFALLFLTQPGIAILFSLFAIAISIALNWRAQNLHPSSLILHPFFGLALGAALTVPVWVRYGTRIAPDGFHPNWVAPYQLFTSIWGFALQPVTSSTSQGTLVLDQFPFQLGIVSVGLAIIAITLDKAKNNPSPLKIFALAAIGVTCLTFSVAAPAWGALQLFATYPWQLLTLTGLALAFIAGAVIDTEARWSQPAMVAFFVGLPLLASYGYLLPNYMDVSPTRPQIAIYDNNNFALLNYRIVGPLRHGATVRIELTWQALKPIARDYTVFVHAVDETGKAWAQDDTQPQTLTTQWMPGQIIFDTHTIQIDVDGPREGYQLEFGLYKAESGERATLSNGADTLILPRPGDPPPTISDQLPTGPTK